MIVKFIENCRDGISWFKGDIGKVTKTLVEKPQATSTIYLVDVRQRSVWATDADFIEWNQLALF